MPHPSISKAWFGQIDGREVEVYTLVNRGGLVLKVMTYGAAITELWIPDRQGRLADVVLGCDSLDGYRRAGAYFGATIGRVANRIRNGRFLLEGKQYQLETNDAPHHLHGGSRGWDKQVWQAEPFETAEGPGVRLSYLSVDGEAGYPGTVQAETVYTLTHRNELRVQMQATSDRTTLVNMVHHSYFNLAGHDSGSILEHELELLSDYYTPGDPVVPTGAVEPVAGGPFDFTSGKPIGRDLRASGGEPPGFDHNWVVRQQGQEPRLVALLRDPRSGRVLRLRSNQPGVQFYSGKFLDGSIVGKGGVTYARYAGLCLETQAFPNAINVPAWRDQVILEPGRTYRHVMVHEFFAE